MARCYRDVARTLGILTLITLPTAHITLHCSRIVDEYAYIVCLRSLLARLEPTTLISPITEGRLSSCVLVRSPVMPTPAPLVVGDHDEAMSGTTPARLARIITDLGNVGTRSARATIARAMKRIL